MQAKLSARCLADSQHPTNDYFLLLCLSPIYGLSKPHRKIMIFILSRRSRSNIGSVQHSVVVELMGSHTPIPPFEIRLNAGFLTSSKLVTYSWGCIGKKFETSRVSFELGLFCVSHSLSKTLY